MSEGWFTVIETPGFYAEVLGPHLQQTPVMSCLAEIVAGTSVDDLRCAPDGKPLYRFIDAAGHTFILIPRPEAHPAAEDWSFARMRAEGFCSYVAFWLHPWWCTPSHRYRIASLSAPRRGGHGQPNRAPRPSALHKPRDATSPYLHTPRDLTRGHVPMLQALDAALLAFAHEVAGEPVPARRLVQYPSAPIKSTFHAQLWWGAEDGVGELGRKEDLGALIEALSYEGDRPPRVRCYRLHARSGAAAAILSRPHLWGGDALVIAGATDVQAVEAARDLLERHDEAALLGGQVYERWWS